MKYFVATVLLVGGLVFVGFMPQIIWEISWTDLFEMISNTSLNKLTEITTILGITTDSAKNWAIQKLIICLSVGAGFVILSIMTFCIRTKQR